MLLGEVFPGDTIQEDPVHSSIYKPWLQTGILHMSIWSHPLLPGHSPAHWTVEISPAAQMRVPGR